MGWQQAKLDLLVHFFDRKPCDGWNGALDANNLVGTMTSSHPNWRRRALLAGGALAIFTWVKGAPHLLSLRNSDLEFEDIADLKPFRRLAGTRSVTTRSSAIFAGLDTPVPPSTEDERILQTVRTDPCAAFFGASKAGPVPIAMFSDFACPICSVMNERLAELQIKYPDRFRIVRHELPILGAASITASRAVLAADRQGAYLEMHKRLMRTPAVTDEAFVANIASDIGLDSDRFLADIASREIDRQLSVTRAIADLFGFFGTPAFAVGRTVFLGAVSKSTLERLIDEETSNPCQTIT